MPQKINSTGTNTNGSIMQSVNFSYAANGIKLRKQTKIDHQLSATWDYSGRFIYADNNGDNTQLAYLTTNQGRIIMHEDGSSSYEFSLKDHLGNTRITFDENLNILQEDAYYPFGMNIAGLSSVNSSPENKYKYNGKRCTERSRSELQDDFGLEWYDYGARMYDAELGRWHVIDSKAEEYYSVTQYAYAIDNPVRFLDPDGNEIVDANGVRITYDTKNGWSSNATSSIKIIHESLMLTETGSQQWEKAYTSASKIEMNIVDENLYSQKSPGKLSLGQTNQALIFDSKTASYVKTDNVMQIKISTGSINESFDGKNKGLTLRQAIGATAGHEIEHTTEENRTIGVQNLVFPSLSINDKGKDRIEIKPNIIGRKIREESRSSFKMLEPIKPKTLDSKSLDPSQGGFY